MSTAELKRRLHEVLEVGGPRKVAILQAIAKHHGCEPRQFRSAIAALVKAKKIRSLRRNGGLHYGPPA